MSHDPKVLLQWKAPMRPQYQRSVLWHVVASIVALVLIGYGVWTDALLMSLAVTLCAFLYLFIHNKPQPRYEITLYETGIGFRGTFRPWDQWAAFWMLQGHGYTELHIAPHNKRSAELVIQTGSLDPYRVRDTLAQFVAQDPQKRERLLDAFIRFCKI